MCMMMTSSYSMPALYTHNQSDEVMIVNLFALRKIGSSASSMAVLWCAIMYNGGSHVG